MHALILIFVAIASVPVRDACSEDAVTVASVGDNDPVQVRHAVVGTTIPCYSVVVTQDSKQVQGFILGSTLPAIQEFERNRAQQSRIVLPPAPSDAAASEEKKAPLPPVGPPFEPWSGADIRGHRLQISGAGSKATLVTLWSVQSGAARHYVESLQKTESEFRAKGLKSFGLIEASSAGKANYYLEDMGLEAPQAFDRQNIAAKYNANTVKGTTLVVDASNNVVAVSSNPAEIRAVLTRLLSSK